MRSMRRRVAAGLMAGSLVLGGFAGTGLAREAAVPNVSGNAAAQVQLAVEEDSVQLSLSDLFGHLTPRGSVKVGRTIVHETAKAVGEDIQKQFARARRQVDKGDKDLRDQLKTAAAQFDQQVRAILAKAHRTLGKMNAKPDAAQVADTVTDIINELLPLRDEAAAKIKDLLPGGDNGDDSEDPGDQNGDDDADDDAEEPGDDDDDADDPGDGNGDDDDDNADDDQPGNGNGDDDDDDADDPITIRDRLIQAYQRLVSAYEQLVAVYFDWFQLGQATGE